MALPIPPLHNAITFDPITSCLNCRHLDRSQMARCDAFPDGIPYPILAGDVAHDEPIAGDGGIQWEAAADAPGGTN